MNRSIKFPNDTYLDSSGITFNKTSLNKILTYSTKEQKIGVWIDDKPIYRKTISFISTSSPYQYNHGIENIDKIVNFYGYHLRGTDQTTFRPLIAYNTTYPTFYNALDSVTKTTIEIFAGDNVKSSLTWYITLEYTKTTD